MRCGMSGDGTIASSRPRRIAHGRGKVFVEESACHSATRTSCAEEARSSAQPRRPHTRIAVDDDQLVPLGGARALRPPELPNVVAAVAPATDDDDRPNR